MIAQQRTATLTLLNFENDWCAQCYTQRPIIQQIASEYQDDIRVQTINVDHDRRGLAEKYDVLAAPTTILIKDHQIVERIPQFIDLAQLQTLIRYYL